MTEDSDSNSKSRISIVIQKEHKLTIQDNKIDYSKKVEETTKILIESTINTKENNNISQINVDLDKESKDKQIEIKFDKNPTNNAKNNNIATYMTTASHDYNNNKDNNYSPSKNYKAVGSNSVNSQRTNSKKNLLENNNIEFAQLKLEKNHSKHSHHNKDKGNNQDKDYNSKSQYKKKKIFLPKLDTCTNAIRKDNYGNIIQKRGKHKICFADNIKKRQLTEVVEIKSIKEFVNEMIKKNNYHEQSHAKCQCACNIY